ncbi:MAG: hypothetical protein Q9220_002580 [cf. Caloplaca sp. 1 TL-2023]
MSSLTKIFGRPRSKSEKPQTPPKKVFGDLNAAYASIAQKPSSTTSKEDQQMNAMYASPDEMKTTSSPLQSPQSECSPSATLLKHRKPEGFRASHLSSDLALPKYFGSEPAIKVQQTWDPISTPNKLRASFTMVDFRSQDLDEYFGTATGNISPQTYAHEEYGQSQHEASMTFSKQSPGLEEAKRDAHPKPSGAPKAVPDENNILERCGTVQSLATCHNYGQIGTNDDIHSVHGAHSVTDEKEEKETRNTLGVMQQDTIEEVEWTPRSSAEARTPASSYQRVSGPPPPFALPQTPKQKGPCQGAFASSGSEAASRSIQSYGDTRKLLELSLPQFPHAAPDRDDFLQGLIDFAHSSSSHESSNHSFAKLSIEAPHRGVVTRPVTQGEFQSLETAINSHLVRENQANYDRSEGNLVHVGQISLRFSHDPEASKGPGSSQTVLSATSDVETDRDIHTNATPPRTRNGTPPLLFGNHSRAKNDGDWETVGDTNDMASSIADYSDSASRSLPKESLSLTNRPVMKLPSHPRYNHSWDLQQDLRNGSYVLTPRYEISRGALVPIHTTLDTLLQRTDENNYSHPTPLNAYHDHPFTAPAPQIAPAENASTYEPHQPTVWNSNTHKLVQSQASSAWLSTAGGSISHAPINSEGIEIYSALNRIPSLPRKNPQRTVGGVYSQESMNFQHESRPATQPEWNSVGPFHHGTGMTSSAVDESNIALDKATGLRSQAHMKSPNRRVEGANVGKKREIHTHPAAAVFSHHCHDPPPTLTAKEEKRSNPSADFIADTIREGLAAASNRPNDDEDIEMQQLQKKKHRHHHRDKSPRPLKKKNSRLWRPIPHPLATGKDEARANSPHLWHIPMSDRSPTYPQSVSRWYLALCAFIPPLLLLYFIGRLNFVMRLHTKGKVAGFTDLERTLALVILAGEVVFCAAFLPFLFILH